MITIPESTLQSVEALEKYLIDRLTDAMMEALRLEEERYWDEIWNGGNEGIELKGILI